MERNPHHGRKKDSSFLSKPLVSLTRLCCRNPVTVVVLSIFAAIASLYWTSEHLGFKMSRLDLINPNSGFNRLWLEYIEEFGDNDEVIVVVEGKGNAEVIPVLETLADRIESFPKLFQGVLHGVDISTIRLKGLHYVPLKELEVVHQFACESSQISDGHWERLNAGTMLDGMTYRLQTAKDPATLVRTLKEIDSFSLSLSKAFASTPSYGSPWPMMEGPQAPVPDIVAACSQNDTSYFLFPTKNGVMGFVLLKLADLDKTQITQGQEAIDKLRSIIASVNERNPTVQIGLTGMPILENDEMRLSNEAMTKATILALVGVGAIFMAGFGGIRHPLLAMVALMVAFAWTMGYITLSVGHLNILSVSFGAMLIGLGTDFSVHYVARYLELRRKGYGTEDALCETAGVVGPGILTGAITTAAAFYMASFTEFTGVAELGMISGGGILLCALATFVLYPAMIQLIDGQRSSTGNLVRSYPLPLDIRGALFPVFRFPATTLVLFAVGAFFLLGGIPKVWYDHNLLHLQPENLESVELEQRLLDMDVEQGGKNVWFALSIADSKEELLARKQQFAEKYPELTVEEIVSWFPEADTRKVPLIGSLAQKLQGLPERPPEIPVSPPEDVGSAIGRLQQILTAPQSPVRTMLRQAGDSLVATPDSQEASVIRSLQQTFPAILKRLNETRESLRRISRSEYQLRMIQYQSAVSGDLLTRLRTLKAMAIPEPPTVDDLPDSLVERFISSGGKHLMRIYTTANIWDMDEMEKFVRAVRDIDPNATGSPLQTYESSLLMQRGFIIAACYAFIAILVLLFFDFRNLRDTFVALLPMSVGFVLMFGIIGWLDLPLNPANMIVLPLVMGIGIDDGIHIVHDFRSQRGRYRITSSTATGILITTLTTIIGFGSMMIASHRGLQSLGRVLVIGVFCCFFVSLIALPAVLSLWTRNRKEAEPEKTHENQANEPGVEYAAEDAPSDLVHEEYVFEQEPGAETEVADEVSRSRRLARRRIA